MTISLSTNVARQSYAVAQGATQSAFTVSFAFFDDDDLNVFVDGTLKTLTTHYTVSGGDGSAGSVTMTSGNEVTGISGGSTVVITRDIDLDRTTDFPASGPFAVATLNTELDKITAQFADRKDVIDRSVRLQDQDEAQSMELPLKADRLGKVLGFNATTGAVEAGPTIADTQSLAAITADIGALADIEDGTIATDAISGLAAIKTNVTTVAGIASNVTSVAGNATNINTVAADGTDIGTVAGISSDVTTVAGISSNVTTVAGKATEVGRLGTADAVSDMNTLGTSSNVTNMNTLAGIASDITTTAGVASSIAASGTNASNAASSATAAASSATAAASSATAAAASQTAAAASAASAASAFDSFDDRFLGSKTSNPSVDNDGDALVTGALYFNSTANEMRVYDGANWIAATSAGNVSLILYEYTATAGQTTFSGSDDNSATLSYTVNNLQVVMNGVVLDPSDFTATSGTSVVLASGAALNDIVNIYAFKSFTTADMVSASAGGTFTGNVTFTNNATVNGAFTSQGIDDNASSTAITIDSSGRVGVGLTTMVNKLALPNSEYLAFQDTGSAESIAIRANSSNAMELLTNGGTSMSIAQGGDVTISDGNLILASGHGIDFSATGSGDDSTGQTVQSELLTDYEHGLWTPTVNGDTTYHHQYGMYQKIGRQVTAWFRIKINQANTPGAGFYLDGLPYNNDHNGFLGGTGLVFYFSSISTSTIMMTARIDGGGSTINFTGNGASGTTAQFVNITWVANNAEIQGMVTYMTDYS